MANTAGNTLSPRENRDGPDLANPRSMAGFRAIFSVSPLRAAHLVNCASTPRASCFRPRGRVFVSALTVWDRTVEPTGCPRTQTAIDPYWILMRAHIRQRNCRQTTFGNPVRPALRPANRCIFLLHDQFSDKGNAYHRAGKLDGGALWPARGVRSAMGER